MIEEFSGGYYRVNMDIEVYDGGPSIESALYDRISHQLYSKTRAPVTMRLTLDGGPRFTPSSEAAIPPDVIGMPQHILQEANVKPSLNENVFILKPTHANIFNGIE